MCLIVGTGVEPMPDVVRSSAPFLAEVIRIKRRTTSPVVAASSLIQRIISPETNLVDGPVYSHIYRVIYRSPGRQVFENVSGGVAERPRAAGRHSRIVGTRERGVDIYRTHDPQGLVVGIINIEPEFVR